MTRLTNPAGFFAALRAGLLGPDLSPSEVDGCNAILDACGADGWPLAYAAYGLATAYHETAHTMQPIKEIGGPAYFRRMYDIEGQRPDVARRLGNVHPGDGAKFPGMGYVQSTGRGNAKRAGDEMDLPIEDQPELLMRPDVAAKVMVRGMREGWFTSKRLADYLPKNGPAGHGQFFPARRIINGLDRADLIAGYADGFQDALTSGLWT